MMRYGAVFWMLMLCGCAVEPPAFRPVYDRFADLKSLSPLPQPGFPDLDPDDEAEIQFRAAFVFYGKQRWSYAATAFAEALDYNEDRHDIRHYLIVSLLLANRDAEAEAQARELLDTPFEMSARPLLARALLRLNRPGEAREAVAPAAQENYDAAGWLARFDALAPLR